MRSACAAALFVLTSALSAQQQLTLYAAADATIYEDDPSTSAGRGRMTSGETLRFDSRRTLIRFDLSTVPVAATIQSAELQLECLRTQSGARDTSVHRVVRAWGEGTSTSVGGTGNTANSGDATWSHSEWGLVPWTNPGGDFAGGPSATTAVSGPSRYSWNGSGMVVDVEAWRSDPSANHGWIVITDESQPSAKQWVERETLVSIWRPTLTLTFDVTAAVTPFGQGCDLNGRTVTLTATGAPSLGNATFSLTQTGGAPLGISVLVLGTGALPGPVPLGNCSIWIAPPVVGEPRWSLADGAGFAAIPLPIPSDSGLLGLGVAAQSFAIDAALNIWSANGLQLTIGS